MEKPYSRMKFKINLRLLFIALLSLVLTAVLITAFFHRTTKEQMQEDTRAYAAMLADSYENLTNKTVLCQFGDGGFRRITLIEPSGEVMADNRADPATMDAHQSRPEVEKALADGTGESIRYSETLDTELYYYAQRLSDGNVLRVSGEVNTLLASFKAALPAIVMIAAVLAVVSVVLSMLLTRQLVRPIEAMAEDMENITQKVPYAELKPFAQAVQEQQNKKSQMDKMRQEFTANVSHELKTPLTSICGYAEMLENGMVQTADVPVFAGKIRKEAGRLVSLIGDILQLSALDAQATPETEEQVSLRDVAEECVRRLAFKADREQVVLAVEGDVGQIRGHRRTLEQLVYNLCDNAIRYNRPEGRVTVTVTTQGEQVLLQVADTGIGIPPEHQERVFERFYRVDKSRSKETGGTGLGLAIVKHIAMQHGATLSLNSTPGEGTTIQVTFAADTVE